MNCGTCANWSLKGSSMRAAGLGLCKADPNEMMRAARNLPPQTICRIGRFEKASIETIAKRERALA
jgi:hypothetical protein